MIYSKVLKEALLQDSVSESKYVTPIRVKVFIKKLQDEDSYPTAQDKFNQLADFSIHPEVLIDNADGTGEICFPGEEDIRNFVEQAINQVIGDEQAKYFDVKIL